MKSTRTSFTWNAEDGFVSGDRPNHTQVDNLEIQGAESLEEAVRIVEEAIRADFLEKVAPGWNEEKLRAKVEEIWNQREK